MSHTKQTQPAVKRKDDWKGYTKQKGYVKVTAKQRRTSFEETLCVISLQIGYDHDAWDKMCAAFNGEDQVGIVRTLRDWTQEFEEKNKNREWNGEDWFEEIYEFINNKLKDIIV